MPIKIKLDPISNLIPLVLDPAMKGTVRSRILANFARFEIAKAAAHNSRILGRQARYETFVDGRHNAPLDSVKPDGRIIAEFELAEDVLLWIGDQLFTHSPWRTGRYTRSHELFIDGRLYDPSGPFPTDFREAFFVNTQPYARKIEGGGSRAPLSNQAPHGVYQVVADLASKRFGNISSVRYGFRTPLFG